MGRDFKGGDKDRDDLKERVESLKKENKQLKEAMEDLMQKTETAFEDMRAKLALAGWTSGHGLISEKISTESMP